MSHGWPFIRGLLILAALLGIAGGLMFLAFKRSEDPKRVLWKTLFSIPVLIAAIMAIPWFGPFGPFLIVLCGVILSILWTPHIGSVLLSPLTSLFDGGHEEPEQRPLYSIALAQRKRGNYEVALNEVRRQLDRFPEDFEGQMLMAEIHADDVKDLPSAEEIVHQICEQEGHPPRHIALALNTLADWHLRYHQDPEAAEAALRRIIELLPSSEFTLLAEQRLAHLPTTSTLMELREPSRIRLRPGIDNIGLLAASEQPKAPEADPAKEARDYVAHLAVHPHDTEAREKLAILYATHYHRLDMATSQLEELIQNPAHPARRIGHWLNLLADLQVHEGAGYEAVRKTLQRIVTLMPESAAGQSARNRIDLLRLEMKNKTTSQTVRLGSYEQDIGLKGRLPHQL